VRKFLFLACALCLRPAFAQTSAEPVATQDTRWFLGVGGEVPLLSFSLSDHATEAKTHETDPNQVKYEPNNGDKFRLRAGYGPYRLSYAITSDPDSESIRTKGKTKHDDIGFSFAETQWATNIFYRSYLGFYVASGDEAQVIRPDIRSRLYGAEIFYSFSPEYSLEPMSYLKWKDSGTYGGWLGYATLDHFEFSGDQAILTRNGFKKASQNTLTMGGGFGGYKSTDDYLIGLNLLASVGPELHDVEYQMTGADSRQQDGLGYTFGFFFGLKGAYRWGGFQLGANLNLSLISTYIGDTGIQANKTDSEFFATYEF
jgi:hypothetical protein